MDKDFWDKVNRLEKLAHNIPAEIWEYEADNENLKNSYGRRFGVVEVNYRKYIAAANPAMILEIIAELRKMWRQNNWDVAALQAYGALPEDMEVYIENESFAWHLNRIKTGLGKRLKLAEKRLEDCWLMNERLEKEADWLVKEMGECNKENSPECPYPFQHKMCPACWREAARKAVSEANNA